MKLLNKLRKSVNSIFCLIGVVPLISAANVTADSGIEIRPFEASYRSTWEVGFFPITVEGTKELKSLGKDLWELSFKIDSSLADYNEVSRFTWNNNVLKPISYQFKQGGVLDKENTNLVFNHKAKSIDSINGKQRKFTEDNIYDRLSYQIQLQSILTEPPETIKLMVAEKKKNKLYEFVYRGKNRLKTAAGSFDTVVYEQIDKHKKVKLRRKTTLWLSKELDYNLVKLEQVFRNNTHVVELTKFNFK